ncbi:hypothetical protein Ga0074812_14345 [Parafrankia irregularis]|uniref:Uncharacterized protein n=1 Tax=Parafrankia irregularis TaxID=795642 RepID=A0A0S4QZD6_9ACTN|nr:MULTISPECIES: hypothetical protein [Frankiaceae]KPM53160.1 hypothetical protein ACG83_27795 [Frankia sp. R43]MBE3204689.1 hypothetical protein [Parafrankia sp. CH37]CUU60628.1 hypothetical protein Ga0074812_14345 [Parafrankia irregularis]
MPQPRPSRTTQPRIIPLTVWPTATPEISGALPAEAAARALATFSNTRDLVISLDDRGILTGAADYLRRRYIALRRTPEGTIPGSTRNWDGDAGLVIDHPPAASPETLLADLSTLARMLRPGGYCLTVHTPAGGSADPLADTITAARAAGLRYLQHIIILTSPIQDDGLHPPADIPSDHGPLHPVHTDLAVFAKPGGGARG